MNKVMLTLAAGAVSALFAGCASVQVAEKPDLNDQAITDGGTIAHINAQNWGLYFLKWPLFTGSTQALGTISVLNEDSVNVPCTVNLLTAKAKEMNASRIEDLQSDRGSTMIPIPIPFLFYLQSTNVSGNAAR